MPYTQVANLDFEDIKSALKQYLRSQSDFTDYDFDGSALSTLIDTLAYNTYYTAFNTNMVVNEMFLDSATIRDNVVALAKQLGYRAKSITAPTAYVDFTVNFSNNTPDTELMLRKGTGFTASFDNELYQYVTLDDVKVQILNNNTAVFTQVPIKEGTQITNTFTVNTSLTTQRYVLDNQNIDTNTILVKVYPTGGTYNEQYFVSDNILDVNSESKVFFLDEVEDERYELIFGDGVLGQKLPNGARVEVSYLVTSGPASNGVKTFVFSGVLENVNGVSPVATVTVNGVVASSGGEDRETVKKIKYNAPKIYAAQNRAVTSNDYDALIRRIYPSVSDIIIFGGEDQVPPQYGRVFIAIKPEDASYLTSITKQQIRQELKKFSIASVIPELVDPSILFVELTSKIYFSRAKTSDGVNQIQGKAIAALSDYIENSDTEKFNGKFRYSKAISVIDQSDVSINSNLTYSSTQ
jgi:hypothetical protein